MSDSRLQLLIAVLALALVSCSQDDAAPERDAARPGHQLHDDDDGSTEDGGHAPGTGVEPGPDSAVGMATDAAADATSPSEPADAADDAVIDGADDAGEVSTTPCAPTPDGATGALEIAAPPEPPVGAPFVVAVSAAGSWSGAVELCLGDRHAADVQLHRGRGSATLQVARAGEVVLSAHSAEAHGELTLAPARRPRRELAGMLQGSDLDWDASADVVVTASAQVPAGATLTIAAGTRVLLAANAGLDVEGALIVSGETALPVLFTRAGADAWGGIRVLANANAQLQHTWLTGGGGDSSLSFGHSDSQPVIFADSGASLELSGGGIVDNPGKALGSVSAHVTLDGVLLSRCDTGGQFTASVVHMEHSYVLEMPDADGVIADDDNDGIYLSSVYEDESGVVPSLIRDSVFAVGEDDGIDHNDAEVRVEHVWIEGFAHEGIAASVGHTITIVDSAIRTCEQGIEAGYGAPQVVVDHCLTTDNDVGLRVGDSYNWATSGSLTVSNSISVGNHSANTRNYVRMLKGPLEGALHITCSLVDDVDYDGMNGNLAGAPEGDVTGAGCAAGPSSLAPECDATVPGPTTCF